MVRSAGVGSDFKGGYLKPKIEDKDLLERLLMVFRSNGFEATSLDIIARETGLKKASLYYRFPGGKVEMADAVLGYVDEWFTAHVLSQLGAEGQPLVRLTRALESIELFYDEGRCSCVLESLSLGARDNKISDHLANTTEAVLLAFCQVAKDAGFEDHAANLFAEDALITIEGTLILQRLRPERHVFARSLQKIIRDFEFGMSRPHSGNST